MSKLAIVTGGARGIGKAIALELAKQGYDIAFNFVNNSEEAENTKKELEAMGRQVYAKVVDVSNYEDCEIFVKEVFEKFGRIDVLVNNAGITKDKLLLRMSKEDFGKVIDVNLVGTFNMSKNVAAIMCKSKCGRIVNISSVVGIEGNAGQSNYAASKAGIIGFTKSLAKELGSRNITVNAVAPGFINTAMTEVLKDEVKESIIATIPLKVFGEVQDVADLVSFLVSEKAQYITGQVINIDGGMGM